MWVCVPLFGFPFPLFSHRFAYHLFPRVRRLMEQLRAVGLNRATLYTSESARTSDAMRREGERSWRKKGKNNLYSNPSGLPGLARFGRNRDQATRMTTIISHHSALAVLIWIYFSLEPLLKLMPPRLSNRLMQLRIARNTAEVRRFGESPVRIISAPSSLCSPLQLTLPPLAAADVHETRRNRNQLPSAL